MYQFAFYPCTIRFLLCVKRRFAGRYYTCVDIILREELSSRVKGTSYINVANLGFRGTVRRKRLIQLFRFLFFFSFSCSYTTRSFSWSNKRAFFVHSKTNFTFSCNDFNYLPLFVLRPTIDPKVPPPTPHPHPSLTLCPRDCCTTNDNEHRICTTSSGGSLALLALDSCRRRTWRTGTAWRAAWMK